MSVEIGDIHFLVTLLDSADLLKAKQKRYTLILKDADVRNKTTGSRILDSTIWAIQGILADKFGLDANETGVIFNPPGSTFYIYTKDFSCPYDSVSDLRDKLGCTVGSIRAPLHVTVYPLETKWTRIHDLSQPPGGAPVTQKRFTF